jgi:MFS family permease
MGLKIKFTVKDTLTEEEVQTGLRAVISEGLASQAVSTLTGGNTPVGGVFLTAFALKLGASNLIIGFLAAIYSLAQLIQIPSVYLVEKYRSRKAVTVYALVMSRISLLFIALIPFLFSFKTGLTFLIIAMAINSAFAAVSVCGWNPWMRDLIPQNQLGAFFSKRMSQAMMLGIPLSLAAGIYLDYWKRFFPHYEVHAYSLLFFFGFLITIANIYFLVITPEPRMATSADGLKFFKLILDPFRDSNFTSLMLFLGLWNFATNLVIPFFTVYMLKRLQLSMSVVIALTAVSQVLNLAFLRIWGRLSDLFSYKSILRINCLLFMVCTLAWTFTTMPDKHLLTLPLLIVIHIFLGISMAGYVLAADNIALKLAPREKATAYLATKNLANFLAAGIAPIIGGKFADFFAKYEFSWGMKLIGPKLWLTYEILDLEQLDFFFLFAFLVGIYAVYRLSMVKESGDVKMIVVLNELRAEMKNAIKNTVRIPLLAAQDILYRLRHLRYQPISREEGKGREYQPISREEGACQPIHLEDAGYRPIAIEEIGCRPDEIGCRPVVDMEEVAHQPKDMKNDGCQPISMEEISMEEVTLPHRSFADHEELD